MLSALDFSKMSVEAFRMPDDWRFKLVDTGIRRSLSDTNYSDPVTTIAARRQHAKEESDRVRAALSSDSRELGAILNESHQSISQNICASTPEIDTLVKELQSTSGVLGARLMGGGFGGMILALVEAEDALPGKLLIPSGPAFIQKKL